MHITQLIHLLGLALLSLGATMLFPLGISWLYQDEAWMPMIWSCGMTWLCGGIFAILPFTPPDPQHDQSGHSGLAAQLGLFVRRLTGGV
jgi:hypothetical protein